MRTNHRFGAFAALTSSWLVAAAAAAAMLAVIILVRPASGHAAQVQGPVVSTTTTSLGKILVDSRGRTLYLFAKDKAGKSSCSGQCATFWPPVIAGAKPRVGSGATASLVGTTKRTDGRMQVTYNHHPLYTFAKDTKKGQTSGEELDAFGAKWYVLSPAGAKIAKPTSFSSSGGGGYSGAGYNP
jgi:predicted lipoprotein with Yx(FWY)xxD motif